MTLLLQIFNVNATGFQKHNCYHYVFTGPDYRHRKFVKQTSDENELPRQTMVISSSSSNEEIMVACCQKTARTPNKVPKKFRKCVRRYSEPEIVI